MNIIDLLDEEFDCEEEEEDEDDIDDLYYESDCEDTYEE